MKLIGVETVTTMWNNPYINFACVPCLSVCLSVCMSHLFHQQYLFTKFSGKNYIDPTYNLHPLQTFWTLPYPTLPYLIFCFIPIPLLPYLYQYLISIFFTFTFHSHTLINVSIISYHMLTYLTLLLYHTLNFILYLYL